MLDRPVWAEVDLSAIASNVRSIRSLIGPKPLFCAVVKADGYGHGVAAVAREVLAAGADRLAVALVTEGLELRAAGFTVPILVMGHTPPDQAAIAAAGDLALALFSLDCARAYSDAAHARGRCTKVHLKIDTGMSRIGVAPEAAPDLARAVAELPGLEIEGAFSHFADADSPDLGFAREQLRRFLGAMGAIEDAGIEVPIRHMANSAATLWLPEARLDMVRPGIALYGLKPTTSQAGPFVLRPAMSLKARISMVKDLPAGVSVGYGRAYTTPVASRIATLPLGYADGWPRALAGRASVALAGGRAPIVGRICMDQFMVDTTGLGSCEAGSEAVLFGEGGPSIDEVASWLGTINYEVVCMIGKRVPRVYVGGRY